MSNLIFLKTECPALHVAAIEAEELTCLDVQTACFYNRHALDAIFASLQHRAFRGEL